MDDKLTITVGRQFGSGGKQVGAMLAERLGVKCYDKELLTAAARESGFDEGILEEFDERRDKGFISSLIMSSVHIGATYGGAAPLGTQIYLAQFNAIKRIAAQESCVIVGRCADYILRDSPRLVSVFIHSDAASRIRRLTEKLACTPDEARAAMERCDRKRAEYYDYYTDKRWGYASTYDLSIDTGKTGIEGAVDLILRYIELSTKH